VLVTDSFNEKFEYDIDVKKRPENNFKTLKNETNVSNKTTFVKVE